MRWHDHPDKWLMGDLEDMGYFEYNESSGGHYDRTEDLLERNEEQQRAEFDRYKREGSRRVKAGRVRS